MQHKNFPTSRGRKGQRNTRASLVLTLVLGPTSWGHLRFPLIGLKYKNNY